MKLSVSYTVNETQQRQDVDVTKSERVKAGSVRAAIKEKLAALHKTTAEKITNVQFAE